VSFGAPLVLALISAVVAWYLIQRHIELTVAARPRLPAPPIEMRQVLVANQILPEQTRIERQHLALRSLPASGLPEDVFGPAKLEELVGQYTRYAIPRGKPLQHLHLHEAAARRLTTRLPPGMRAFTIRAEVQWTHHGALETGDLVDLYQVHETHWERIVRHAEVIQLAPIVTDMSASHRYEYVTFAIEQAMNARLYELHEMSRLRFVLRSMKHNSVEEGFGDVLEIERLPELIGVKERVE